MPVNQDPRLKSLYSPVPAFLFQKSKCMAKTRLSPTPSVIKKLFAYTGNQCAMPDCQETLVDVSGTMLGKIAHICAAEPGGPRYDR
jgi:hypothetical protein